MQSSADINHYLTRFLQWLRSRSADFLARGFAVSCCWCVLVMPASAYDCFEIHIGGTPDGGNIVVNRQNPYPDGYRLDDRGDFVPEEGNVPPGTCGIRWRNPEVWFWTNNGRDVDLLPSSEIFGDHGDGIEFIEFSGPYPGCESAEYFFRNPLSFGTRAPTHLATTLVVQALPSDVMYLDKNMAPIQLPVPLPPEPPPEPPDLCTSVPEFCDTPDSFVLNPCNSPFWAEICGSTENIEIDLFRVRDLTADVGDYVFYSDTLLASGDDGNRTLVEDALEDLTDSASLFTRLTDDLREQRNRLVARFHRLSSTSLATRTLRNISVDVKLGSLALSRCLGGLDEVREDLGNSELEVEEALTAAAVDCDVAEDLLERAVSDVGRIRAWVIPNEGPRFSDVTAPEFSPVPPISPRPVP